MKRTLITLLVVVAAGLGYWLISPLFLDTRVAEEFPETRTTTDDVATQPQVVATGTFSGFDAIHRGSGDVSIIRTEQGYVVRLEENFEVSNGPDLFVGLGKDGEYREEAQLEALKGNIGSQNYVVPDDIDVEEYNEVWIWCRAFSVPFAKAVLK